MPDEFIRSTLPRYGRVPRNLLRNPQISDRAVRLYGLLDDFAGVDGAAFPKRALLAGACRCSVSAVAKALAELEQWGFIQRTPRFRQDGSQTSTLYTLGAGRDLPEGVDVGTRGGVPGDTPGVDVVTHQEGDPGKETQGSTPQPPQGAGRPGSPGSGIPLDGELIPVADVGSGCDTGNMDEPVATRSRKVREVSDDDQDWSAFWAAYPRKIGKGAARKAWTKALAKVTSPSVLIEGAKAEAAALETRKRNPRPEDRGRDLGQFVPHPSTWLNQERWEDEKQEQTGGARWSPAKKGQDCPKHPGEDKDRCRACAADRLAGDTD